jgi:AraC-like DNA-binding protein
MNLRYQEFPPSPHLAAHIECFWTHCADEPVPSYRVLPDGCADILFERPGGRRGQGLIIVGAMTRAQSFEIPARQFTLGVRFRPTMATRFLRVPAPEIVDAMIALDDAWGPARKRRLLDQLAESKSPAECIRRFEAELPPPPALDPVEKAIAWLVQSGGQISVEDLADAAGLSPRQFRRVCLERSGLTPKRLARILRFRHATLYATAHAQRDAAQAAHQLHQRGWADIALECGYYDQAHLINEFREFSGLAPSEFAAASDAAVTPNPAPPRMTVFSNRA